MELNTDIEIGAIENEERDDRDALALYVLLENEIVPEFYDPEKWSIRAMHSHDSIPPYFSTDRMVREYADKYYGVGVSTSTSV